VGVWHFAGQALDSSPQHLDAEVVDADFAAGKLGQAALLQRNLRQHIGLKRGLKLVSGARGVTESAWVKTNDIDPNAYGVVLGVGTAAVTGHLSRTSFMVWGSAAAYPFGAQPLHNSLYGEINPDDRDGAWSFAASPIQAVSVAAWHHVAAVFDVSSKGVTLYVDGAKVAGPEVHPGNGDGGLAAGSWTSSAFAESASDRVEIGTEEDATHGFFDGMIDELRVESIARSADWIAAQARGSSGSAVSVGPEQLR
jgi:hypothetical protein